MSFLDRFTRLEIPEERRNLDWTFLDAKLDLPRPLPLEAPELWVLINGRVLVPEDRAPAEAEARVLFYAEHHALVEAAGPEAREAAYRADHEKALGREAKRFYDSAPGAIVAEPMLMLQAIDVLRASAPQAVGPLPGDGKAVSGALSPVRDASLLATRLTGHLRLMRIHAKLYDLVTLKEYARIFEKAIEPALFRRLQTMDDTVTPEAMLALIEANKDAIHAKARSPLRNKMATARVTFNGVTLLPIYREPAQALLDAHAKLLSHDLKLKSLESRSGAR